LLNLNCATTKTAIQLPSANLQVRRDRSEGQLMTEARPEVLPTAEIDKEHGYLAAPDNAEAVDATMASEISARRVPGYSRHSLSDRLPHWYTGRIEVI
jgi:hypothetical protein